MKRSSGAAAVCAAAVCLTMMSCNRPVTVGSDFSSTSGSVRDKCDLTRLDAIDSTFPWSAIKGWISIPPDGMVRGQRSPVSDSGRPDDSRTKLASPPGQPFPVEALLIDPSTLGAADDASRSGERVLLPYDGQTRAGSPVEFAVALPPAGDPQFLGACDWEASDFLRTARAMISTGQVQSERDLVERLAGQQSTQPLWQAFLTAQNAPNTIPATVPWASRQRDQRSMLDADAPPSVLATMASARVRLSLPEAWAVPGHFAVCWRNSIAMGACLQTLQPNELPGNAGVKELSVEAPPGETVEFFVGDTSKQQSQTFVVGLGSLSIDGLMAASSNGSVALRVDPQFASQSLEHVDVAPGANALVVG